MPKLKILGTKSTDFYRANLHNLRRSLGGGEHPINCPLHLLHALRELLHVLVRGGVRP